MPEPEGSFHNDASVPRAGAASGWSKLIGWRIFRAAARIICEWRAVTADLVEFERSRGCRGNCRSRGSSRDGRCFGNRNAVVALICRAPCILGAEVGVDVQFRVCVELQLTESMGCAD